MSQELSLDSLGLRYGTDKASSHHDYLEFYEAFFGPRRHEPLNILEIGVLEGASLKTWEAYFPNAMIIGADHMQATKRFAGGRISVELLDQSNIEDLVRVAVKHGPFDIIVEDGSHMWEHQITSLRTLFPFVSNNGFYIVEDLQTNYGSLQQKYKGVASSSCVEYLKKWVDLRVADHQLPLNEVEDAFLRTYARAVQFLTFYRRACLIKKQASSVDREGVGQPLLQNVADFPAVPVRVRAHVAHKGDMYGGNGFVNLGPSFALQGVSIEADGLLEYRVCGADQAWSDWAHDNTYVGTKGQSKSLRGISVRLRDGLSHQYSVRTIGRFVDCDDLVQVSDGEDCTSGAGKALCGLQVVLTSRS